MIPWLVGHGKSIAHSAWSFAFVTKNPTKVQKCNFFAFGRPWKFPWPTPWKFPGPGNFHGLNLLLPMEISRAWKFPWHGKFQALTPTYPCRIFLMENILQWIYFCSAICCCLFEIFMGKKPRGGLVKDQTLFNIFFGNLPVYILIFASIIFILVRNTMGNPGPTNGETLEWLKSLSSEKCSESNLEAARTFLCFVGDWKMFAS